MRGSSPHRRQLKASLHSGLFRWLAGSHELDITVRPNHHVRVELIGVRNPLFRKYGEASAWQFGLTLRPHALLSHFRVPSTPAAPLPAVMGVELNFDNADLASTEGTLTSVDLGPICRIQERMAEKRQSIQRHISKDLRHQRAVLRRYHRRVAPLLHRAANQILEKVGGRTLVFEELTDVAESILRREKWRRSPTLNRRLSAWSHGRLVEIVTYKARTQVVWVNRKGTSRECPRCGGRLALPSEGESDVSNGRRRMTRRMHCAECGGEWHRGAAAAIAVLARGCHLLWGATLPPSARNALLEAAAWHPGPSDLSLDGSDPGLTVGPVREDDAKSGISPRNPDT
ncbi:MAG: transposase [Thermoplasmata archaeon]